MRAIVVDTNGGPEVLTLEERSTPQPALDQVLVEVKVSGVNFIDTYHRTGSYPMPLPFVPGLEGSGTVIATGSDVSEISPGDRIAWHDTLGSYADHVTVRAERAVRIPRWMTEEQAASAMLQGMTAHYLTHDAYPVQPGDTALVHAAAGGVGLLVTQMVKLQGGTVIGTVSTAAKAQLAREAGADEVVRYSDSDIVAEVSRLTDRNGVAVVYDGVGRATFDASLASLRPRGMLVLYGAASGSVPPFDLQRLNQAGSLFVTRPTLAHYTATHMELLARAQAVFDLIQNNRLILHIGQRYALAEARQAHEDLEARRTTGKVLLFP